MPFKQIGSPESKYLTATDILIGDMSDTNYEFLLFDRPIILLANQWLRENFPDIGIKTDLAGLEDAIERGINSPGEFKKERSYWLNKTIYQPDGNSSKRVLATIIEKSRMNNPKLFFIHGNDPVRRTTLHPLYEEAKREGFSATEIARGRVKDTSKNIVYIAAHNAELKIHGGFKVHLDHGLKGVGVADFERQIEQYRKDKYLPATDLHITEGEVSLEKTKILVGPYQDRVVMAGYPKADDLIRLNTEENKTSVYKELGFDISKPLITYAPAARESYMKPGGSLSREVIDKLKEIALRYEYNILVKLKYPRGIIIVQAVNKLRRMLPV